MSEGDGLDRLIRDLDEADPEGTSISYAPTLQFYGDAPRQEDIERALDNNLDKFDEMMQRWMRERRRVSFR